MAVGSLFHEERKLDGTSQLAAVSRICRQLYAHKVMDGTEKATNFMLLPVLDYKGQKPSLDQLCVDMQIWIDEVDAAINLERVYNHNKFSDILLPVRICKRWALILCDM